MPRNHIELARQILTTTQNPTPDLVLNLSIASDGPREITTKWVLVVEILNYLNPQLKYFGIIRNYLLVGAYSKKGDPLPAIHLAVSLM